MKRNLLLILLCLIGFSGFAQDLEIKGVVTNKLDGSPIPGVSIIVKNTSKGTITDFEGNYTLKAQSGDILVFSFIGFKAQEIEVTKATMNVELAEDLADLGEVVVVGYGVQKKSLVTGAISGVEAKDMANASSTNAQNALQGKTPGVLVTPQSGSPGAGMNLKIRGAGTNGNPNPLYIVDGVRMSDITSISSNDILSMEVLKDGASSAIYGAEGGNGVVMITTKKGEAGAGRVSYDFSYGIQSAPELPTLLNAKQYQQYQTEMGNTPKQSDYDTDWLDEIFSDAPIQSHNISFSGGTDKSTFFSSVSYVNQEGIVGEDKAGFERLTARFNADHKVKQWLKVGINASFSHSERKVLNEDDEFGGLISSALLIDPYTAPTLAPDKINKFMQENVLDKGLPLRQDANGNYFAISENVRGEMVNPLLQMDIAREKAVTNRFTGTMSFEVSLADGIKFTSRPSLDYSVKNTSSWTPTYYYSNERSNTTLATSDNYDLYYQWQLENFINIDKQFGDHGLSAVLGMSAQENVTKYVTTNTTGMGAEDASFAQHDYTSETTGLINGNKYIDRMVSYFGRASYNYKGKYMLQGTIRNDITSTAKVHSDGKSGVFPSFSAGWVFSEEDFFTNDFITSGKLRASWGQNGSIAAISKRFMYMSVLTSSKLSYPIDSQGAFIPVVEPSVLPNSELTWETSEQTNLGVDLRMLDSRVSFSADYFEKTTKDLLMLGSTPATSGNAPPYVNAGDVTNSGLEFSLGFKGESGDLNYGVNVNYATLSNEVTKLNTDAARVNGTDIGTGSWPGATAFKVGEPIWYFRGYETNGIDAATGNPIFVDKDGKNTMDPTEEDRKNIGSPHPTYTLGMSLFAEYKGLDLNVVMQGQGGHQAVIGWVRPERLTSNMPAFFYEGRWTPTNTNASMPAAKSDIRRFASDLMVQDADYIRIKQIQLGYTLPSSITESLKLQKVRAYISLDDYFTFTDYEGMDPDAGSVNYDSQGIDRGVYPTARKMMFGLNVSF